jgi:hypothetical protein
MGTGCGKHSLPDTENLCGTSLGDRPGRDEWPDLHLPSFATLDGVGGNPYRNRFCKEMSNAGEWGDPRSESNSSYNDCNNYQLIAQQCCNGCCGIRGRTMSCKRLKFTGDALECCFKDFECSRKNNDCFSDKKRNNTCSDGKNGTKNNRSISGNGCRDVLFDYCLGQSDGDDPDSSEWLNRWSESNGVKKNCVYFIQRNLFISAGPPNCGPAPLIIPGICNIPLQEDDISSSGHFWASRLVSAAIEKYNKQGFTLGSLPGTEGYNPFQDLLYDNVCCPYASVCQDALEKTCSNKTAQRISLNPDLNKWCGCHLPAEEYLDYSRKFNIPPECTPMCNRVSVLPITGINSKPVNCNQSICLIDDISVNLVNAQIKGGLNFNQICGTCPSGSCSCIIDNDTVDIRNSTIGGNATVINEGCGGGVKTQTNPGITGPNKIDVNFDQNNFNPYKEFEKDLLEAKEQAFKLSSLWTLLIIGLGILIVYILIYIYIKI